MYLEIFVGLHLASGGVRRVAPSSVASSATTTHCRPSAPCASRGRSALAPLPFGNARRARALLLQTAAPSHLCLRPSPWARVQRGPAQCRLGCAQSLRSFCRHSRMWARERRGDYLNLAPRGRVTTRRILRWGDSRMRLDFNLYLVLDLDLAGIIHTRTLNPTGVQQQTCSILVLARAYYS